ncbi:hypothetical protein CR513_39100, partial [Mucuna pruriens]
MLVHRGQKVTIKPQSPLTSKEKNDEKKDEKGKEVLITSKRVVKKALLVQKEPLYLLPINMCFHSSRQFPELPVGFKQMLESFQDIFPKDIPRGLPPIRGIDHQIDFIMGAHCQIKLHIELTIRRGNKSNNRWGSSWKKDGHLISCLDYLLDELHGACIFLKIDMLRGYHQIHIRETNERKTSFKT